MPFASAPFAAVPFSANRALVSSGGNQTTAPAAVVATATYPAQTLSGSGTVSTAPAAVVATAVYPVQTLTQPGTLIITTAMGSRVVPGQTVGGSGSATLTPTAVVAQAVIPGAHITGGIQPSNRDTGWQWRHMGPINFNKGVVVVPSNTVNFATVNNQVLCKAIFVGTAGTVQVVFFDDTVVPFVASAGEYLYVAAKRVHSTGTTASDMVALYQSTL